MRKSALAAVAICAVVLTASLTSPAIGGPSIRAIAKTAKKALSLSKRANRSVKAGLMIYVADSGDVPAAPGDFAEFDVKCPRGYQPTGFSMGLGPLKPVAILATPGGYIGNYYNPPETNRILSGTLDVNCVKGRRVFSANSVVSRASALRRLAEARRAVLAAGSGARR